MSDLDILTNFLKITLVFVLIVLVFALILEIIRCISLYQVMKTTNHPMPWLAFVPIVNYWYEGCIISDILEYKDNNALICKICFIASSLVTGSVNVVSNLYNTNAENDIFSSAIILPAIVASIISIIGSLLSVALSIYIIYLRIMALNKVGYGMVESFIVVIFISLFYLFLINSKLKNNNQKPKEIPYIEQSKSASDEHI